jgi:hypothetical protein
MRISDLFYMTLPSEISGSFCPRNIIASYKTKLATPIELFPDQWEIGLLEISSLRDYKQKIMEIKFPENYYESLREYFVTEITFQIGWERSEVAKAFHTYLKEYLLPDGYDSGILVVCYGKNSLQTGQSLVFHFSAQVYDLLEDLAKIIMTLINCTSSEVTVLETDASYFALPELFYICRDITYRNIVGDSDFRILTTLLFTSKTSYIGLDNPLCRPVEQSFIQSISIPLVT